ncbi:MAG: universal stress protein [Chloroflexi bacterium]|nr:universal stress protein [Chloroflexota bacterium]
MTSGTALPPAHLLVALDGSALAETVLALLRSLATPLGARVTLLHVLEHGAPATVHGQPHLTTAAAAEAYLRPLATRLGEGGLAVATHVHPNPEHDVAASIAAHAAELDADLIVLATHGHGGMREWLVGRIPEQVAARAGRPVLIVPAPAEREVAAVRRLMLPVDQAGEARAALPLARRLAIACQAQLVLVTVVPTPATLAGDAGAAALFLPQTTTSLLNWAEEQARAALDELAEELARTGLACTTDVRRGDPARAIVQAIGAHGVDLVVLATHARVGLGGLWAGSVTPRVVAAASCPLLLVPIPR